ncbi:dihydrofolate reductase family protein [Actinokineospora sp. HUAS TT18]|uniref:dihydrofolate reductase family protein n=1 Tax=Actinokineospora sp. HUAS TT18 TaxID=3447451 RepID=UPI003F51B323
MGKLVVTEFVSLDGVIEDPGGAEGFEHGGWSFKNPAPDGDAFKFEELMAADAQLLGRKTYEAFAAAWPEMTDEAGFADKMNSMPKYVVSTTLTEATWNNTTVIADNVAEEVAKVKAAHDGDILIAGSSVLIDTLREHDLIDEYRLMVHPVVLGTGKRLFNNSAADLELVESRNVGPNVLLQTYRPAAKTEE